MMEIDIVGEDQVTQKIIEKLIVSYRPDIIVKSKLPVRGSQIKNIAPKLNQLGSPIFLLTDLDLYHCAPSLIADWLENQELNENMLFRVAIEEAETWLMADRIGFSKWLGISSNLIPTSKTIDKSGSIEIIFPYKPSLFMMMELASKSLKKELRESLTPFNGAKKGPGYNSAIIPFIQNNWTIEEAAKNSTSLTKAINRLLNFKY